ncbi:metallophosphoesterase [Putridiphycobacter roseus]|uniref:Metallophosphoesterase n=1 Tax=Putridiphycobacter roseus TaxID=2219161 RepID=A0A2W1N1N0_9FLAO|nr:metallophosphoesterase [Putridiphycobacter roseus]PZE16851.1 metallophosphoesterase [Putridiphycobacter roseus]
MNSPISFIIILLVFLGIELYIYFWLRSYWQETKIKYRKIVKYLYLGVTSLALVSLLLILTVRDYSSVAIANIFIGVFIINLITKLVLLPFALLDDVRRLGLFTKKKIEHSDKGINRSAFLQKAGLLTAAIPLTALTTGVVIGGAYRYKIHKEKLSFKNFPKAFNGLKVVQISDIHSGSFYDKEAVKRGVKMIMDQKPDLVFFTGDIVNEQAVEMDNYYEVFDKIKAPLGVYSILGNHDYGDYHNWENNEAREENFEAIKKIHQKLGWNLLLDEHIYLERGGERIAVIGVENWGAGFHQIGDLKKAYKGCDAPFKILLSHDPTHWDKQVTVDFKDIDLTLSGHTHGAQMGIETHGFKWSPIQYRYKKWAGLYALENQKLYINRGFGFLGYPGRIGIWPEITVLEFEHNA